MPIVTSRATSSNVWHELLLISNAIGVPITKHDKLPDVVLYSPRKNWLFLIEAVTSHGPVSPKRKMELEQTLGAWVADMPDHMIHFNGDKFLGPA